MVPAVLMKIQVQTLVVIAMETDKEQPVALRLVAMVANDRQIRHPSKDVLYGLDLVVATITKDFAPDARMVLGVEQNIIVIRRMKVVAEDVVLLQTTEVATEASRLIPLIA